MATDLVYPTSAEIREVERTKMPNLIQDRPVFNVFPIREVDDHVIQWAQADNYTGLQQIRGINGAPLRVNRKGAKLFTEVPGVYGEFSQIDELEITRRRQYATANQRIRIDDLVMQEQDFLLGRRLDRIESIVWTLLVTGVFSVPHKDGAVVHAGAYTTQTFTAGVAWATSATATPLANFRAVKLLARGYSVVFDGTAEAWMNSTTANNFYGNLNANDLFGRREAGGSTLTRDGARAQLTGDNLPVIREYDGGYLDDTNTFQLFIPNNKVVVVGRRPSGVPVGEFLFTRNANNAGAAPGPYTRVIDRGLDSIPRSIEVHDGFNGGPTLLYPSSVVVMNV